MPFNLAGLAKQLGPEVFSQISAMTPEMTGMLQNAMAGSGGVTKVEKSAAVSTAVQNLLAPPPASAGSKPSSGIDKLQTALDIAGVIDPTPTFDAINAGISLVRAAKSNTAEERSHHIKNAVISGISMVPYIGDLAKIEKLGGKTASKVAAKETAVGADTVAGGLRTGATVPRPASPVPHPPSGLQQPGSPPLPPPPPGTPPTSPAAAIPPPVPPLPGSTFPAALPTSPTVTPTHSPFLPLLAGAAAGAAVGMFAGGSGGDNFMGPQHYSLTRDTLGPEKVQAGHELGQIVKNRGAEIFNPLLHPINALLHPISSVTQSFTGLFKAADEIPSAIMHWGESLTESQRHLQQWSGTLANAFQESQVRQNMRDFGSAGRTAGTTVGLRKALDDLKDDIQPLKDAFTNVTNVFATGAERLLHGMLTLATNFEVFGISLGGVTEKLNKVFEDKDPARTAVFDFMENVRKLPDKMTKRLPRTH